MGRLAGVGSVLVLTLVIAAAALPAARNARSLDAYSGLGAWISIYDTKAVKDPAGTIETLAAEGVGTVYLETSNYRQRSDIVRPESVAELLQLAHSFGMKVVAWYLPSLAAPARDLRRALAAIEFETSDGQQFDSFALDLESTVVRSISRRNLRAVLLAGQVRDAAPADYPLGAITIAPVGASPSYWPRYPFQALSKLTDVFLPMAYFTARTKGATGVRSYTIANVVAIRVAVGDPSFPIHTIGGVAPRAKPAEVRGFVQAASACDAVGASFWEFGATTDGEWAELAPLAGIAPLEPAPTAPPVVCAVS